MKKTLRVLTAGLLGTATIATIGLPQRARAAGFSYVYAYQQITNLRASIVGNPLSLTFGSDNVSNAAILQGTTNNPLNLQSVFDVNESFVRPPTIGANLGLGNNAGFFTNPSSPTFSSAIGINNLDYARGDAQLVGITNTNQIAPALFGSTGLSLVGVAESYLKTPTQLEGNGFFLNQGNGIGRTLLASNDFTVGTATTIDFSYDYRNEGFAQLTLATPPGAPLGNQAAGRIAFVITINTIAGINVNPVYTCNPLSSNNDFGVTDVNASDPGVNAGSVLLENSDSDGGCDSFVFSPGTTYRIDFRNELIADTRLLDAPIVPEPGATGMLLGLGSFGLFRLTLKRNKK